MSDQIVGGSILVISFSILVYYTLWAFAVPFLESDHPLLNYFPPYDWVIKGPILLLLIGAILISTFIGSVILKSRTKKNK